MNSDPRLITPAQIKQALAVMGLEDGPPHPGRDNDPARIYFISLHIGERHVTIERIRPTDKGYAGTETVKIPIGNVPPPAGPRKGSS